MAKTTPTFVFIFCLSIFIVHVVGSCFPISSPPVKNSHLSSTACCWYSGSTCCPLGLGQSVAQFATAALNVILPLFGGEANDCYNYIGAFYCSFCDPNTASFISGSLFSPNPPSFTICDNFCQAAWGKCTPYLDALNDLAASYNLPNITSATELCDLLPAGDSGEDGRYAIKISSTNTNCFGNNYPISVVAESGCLPGQYYKD